MKQFPKGLLALKGGTGFKGKADEQGGGGSTLAGENNRKKGMYYWLWVKKWEGGDSLLGLGNGETIGEPCNTNGGVALSVSMGGGGERTGARYLGGGMF